MPKTFAGKTINELLDALGDMGADAVARDIRTEQRRMGDTLVHVIWALRSLDAVLAGEVIPPKDPAARAYLSILEGTRRRAEQARRREEV